MENKNLRRRKSRAFKYKIGQSYSLQSVKSGGDCQVCELACSGGSFLTFSLNAASWGKKKVKEMLKEK